jgi:hypothetical protein
MSFASHEYNRHSPNEVIADLPAEEFQKVLKVINRTPSV